MNSAEHIHILQIPAPNDFGLVYSQGNCTTDTGLTGIRNEPTPVDVTVQNLPLGCENTLSQALVYIPEDQTCVAAPEISLAPLVFPPTESPGPSAPQTIFISNGGGGDLLVSGMFLGGDFYFDAGCSTQAAPGFTVPSFTNGYAGPDVYFCPANNDGLPHSGELRITSHFVVSPFSEPLPRFEAHPILGVNPSDLTFNGPYPEEIPFDVFNDPSATGDLHFAASVSPTMEFIFAAMNASWLVSPSSCTLSDDTCTSAGRPRDTLRVKPSRICRPRT